MSSTALRLARSSSRAIAERSAATPGNADPLVSDWIDYDAWLLPPLAPGPGERAIRVVSCAAGPIALTAAIVGLLALH